ncbi:MAG: hypothetical protein QF792_00565, partial [Phycisphaerae bacterium]|nr:hypothetical protein [Phycisphaerae bacterium]
MDDPQTSGFGADTPTGSRPPPPVVWVIALGGSVGGTLAAIVENSAHAMNPLMGVLLLVDFGDALISSESRLHHTIRGTFGFIAPEMFTHRAVSGGPADC